jgi:hypothetical protein
MAFLGQWPDLGRAALIALLVAVPATAWPAEEAEEQATDEARTIVFMSGELGGSAYATAGFKRVLDGATDTSGFVVMGSGGAGRVQRREIREEGPIRVDSFSMQASLLAGYQGRVEQGVFAFLLGPEVDYRPPSDSAARRAHPLLSARLQIETWLHPTDDTLVTATLVAGTAGPHLWARATLGYRVWRDVHFGPEASLYVDSDNKEARIGLQFTGLSIGRFALSASGGLMLQERGEHGAYFVIGTYFPL